MGRIKELLSSPVLLVIATAVLLGAAIAGILWEVGKNLFANSVGTSVRYSTIYGSLAVVPIFLIWLYITWIIVLLGLEISFTHQHFAALVRSRAAGERDECDHQGESGRECPVWHGDSVSFSPGHGIEHGAPLWQLRCHGSFTY